MMTKYELTASSVVHFALLFLPLFNSCVLMGLYIITTRVHVEEVNEMVPQHKGC